MEKAKMLYFFLLKKKGKDKSVLDILLIWTPSNANKKGQYKKQ